MSLRTVTLTWEGKAAALEALARPERRLVMGELFRLAVPSAPATDPGVGAAGSAANTAGSGREESPGFGKISGCSGRIVQGDALDVALALAKEGAAGQVDLVYVDPPFDSGVDYVHEHRFEGSASGPVERTTAYGDRWGGGPAEYLDMLYPRLLAAKPLLKPTGSIWVHVDWRANYYVRALCDEIFGRERFLNEIIWRRAPNLGRQARSGQFGRTLDTIIVYAGGPGARLCPPLRLQEVPRSAAKRDETSGRYFTLAPRGDYTDASVERLEAEGRIYRSPSGNVYVRYWLEEKRGVLYKRAPADALWSDVPPLRHVSPSERTGYPTQKPRALLERIVIAASPPGGLVVDLFAGSGTTGAAAAATGRSFVLGDASPVAISVMRARLLRETNVTLRLDRVAIDAGGAPPLLPPSPRSAASRAAPSFIARRVGTERLSLEMQLAPKGQPLAWAIDAEPAADGTFRAHWYAARSSGRRPEEAPAVADLAIRPGASVVEARAYFSDGSSVHSSVPVPADCPTAALDSFAVVDAPAEPFFAAADRPDDPLGGGRSAPP